MKTNILLIDYREPSYRSIKLAYPQYNFWWARKPNEADGILVNFSRNNHTMKGSLMNFGLQFWMMIYMLLSKIIAKNSLHSKLQFAYIKVTRR